MNGDFVTSQTYPKGYTVNDEGVKEQLVYEQCDLCECNGDDSSYFCECHQYMSNKTFTTIHELVSCLPHFPHSVDLVMELNISGFNFGIIPNGSFSNIPYVQTLSIRACNITKLEPNAFKGLNNLSELAIVDSGKDKEGISILNYHLLQHCQKTKILSLGKVRNIANNTFFALPKLIQLTLEDKGILEHHQIFKSLHKLQILILNGIGLNQIPGAILHYLPFLTELHLANNAINSLQFDGKLTTNGHLTLDLQGNNIKSVTKTDMSQFKKVANLSLNLADNDLEDIEPNYLQDIKVVDILSFNKNLKLGKTNALKNMLESCKGKPIKDLQIAGCGIVIDKFNSSFLEPLKNSNLQSLSIGYNLIDRFETDAFEPVKSLRELDISNFMHISSETFAPLQDLSTLRIHDMSVLPTKKDAMNVSLIELENLDTLFLYKLDFSRIIFTLRRYIYSLMYFKLTDMGEAFEAYHDQVLNLITNSYLFSLDLSGNLLFRYSDTALCELFNGVDTSEFRLCENYFKILPDCIFQNIRAQLIDLSQNRITYIQEGLFKNIPDIINLNLAGNSISLIDGTALTVVGQDIQIENNVIECNCATQPFTKWLRRRKHQRGLVTHDKFCASPTGPTNEELLKFELTWVQCNMEAFVRIISLSVSSVILIGILTASLLKYFWRDIKYMQLVRRAKQHNGYIPIVDPNDNQNDILIDDIQDDEVYDAFISYHSEKRIWVRDVMTPELTKGDVQFSLIHDDNIIPGQESYFGGLMSHMDRSRHIIFLVTRGWMQEGWNEFEMDSAIDMLTQTKRHTLIVVLMENIPQKEMSHKLKLMVRHNVCLKWSEEERKQRKFWRDLKLELGKKRYM
ncbi:unnamed protein product [Owenia fusiformis]|uniref:TIR domain-containing protein n=1 Tax=Owenia fusiformis TaxID=6347 RepID=A0A8S4NT05_OWEFU|nr:unnamed protein product [Owenia fusiformis]